MALSEVGGDKWRDIHTTAWGAIWHDGGPGTNPGEEYFGEVEATVASTSLNPHGEGALRHYGTERRAGLCSPSDTAGCRKAAV